VHFAIASILARDVAMPAFAVSPLLAPLARVVAPVVSRVRTVAGVSLGPFTAGARRPAA